MLVDPSGKPIASEPAVNEMVKRGQENFEAVLKLLDERQVTNDELLDLLANVMGVWCEKCAASVFERNGNLLMNAFMTQIQKVLPLKMGELKVRKSLEAGNTGAGKLQ